VRRWFVALHALPRIHKRLTQVIGGDVQASYSSVTDESVRNLIESTPCALRTMRRELDELQSRLNEIEERGR
jgi:hypothetical protein